MKECRDDCPRLGKFYVPTLQRELDPLAIWREKPSIKCPDAEITPSMKIRCLYTEVRDYHEGREE